MEKNNNQAVLQALGYPVLPQTIVRTPKTEYAIQRTQYEPEKLQSVLDALKAKRATPTYGEIIARSLSKTPDAQSFKGAYGVDVVNPWAQALSSFSRSFGDTYSMLSEANRNKADAEREDAIKAAQLEAEATKQAITDKYIDEYTKVNDPLAKSAEMQQQAIQQRESARAALKELVDISKGGIGGWNNEADSRWNSTKTANLLGRRDQALSALIPLTNAQAKASGGSGINTLGEMMAYVGLPENATSAQIKGALPGLINKLGFNPDEVYEMSTIPEQRTDNSYNINGFTIKVKQ